jgi:hypothetical protein
MQMNGWIFGGKKTGCFFQHLCTTEGVIDAGWPFRFASLLAYAT